MESSEIVVKYLILGLTSKPEIAFMESVVGCSWGKILLLFQPHES